MTNEVPSKHKLDTASDEDIPEYISGQELLGTNGHKKQKYEPVDNRYLETINRSLLDFDFETVCSVTLSNVNVYCCLVCGRYFQGRSKSTPAYNHSLTSNHHVYINLTNEKVYILPDNYEVLSAGALDSLQDIKNVLRPRYKKGYTIPETARDLSNNPYQVGYIGLNNIQANDYCNVIIQALSHIPSIRDFYLSISHKQELNEVLVRRSPLNAKFATLIQKIWSSHLFKSHISPQDFLQLASLESKKKFSTIQQNSPKKFLVWLLNQLHTQLSKSIKSSKTPFSKSFRGSINIKSTPLTANEINRKVEFTTDNTAEKSVQTNFWVLTFDLPTTPVFSEQSKIEEISLYDLLDKYNGVKTTQTTSNELKTYELISPLPPFLIFHIDRDLESDGNSKRGNPIVVKYPEILDMSAYVKGTEKLNYRLTSTIKYESILGQEIDHGDDKLKWSISLKKKENNWVDINDLEVKPCSSELLFLENNYIQVWERI